MNHRTEQDVDLSLLPKDQFPVMTADAFNRVAAIHRPASLPEFAALLLGGVGAEDDILRGHAQSLQETHPELMRRPDIQYFGNSDAELRPVLRPRRGGTLLCEPSRQHSDRH